MHSLARLVGRMTALVALTSAGYWGVVHLPTAPASASTLAGPPLGQGTVPAASTTAPGQAGPGGASGPDGRARAADSSIPVHPPPRPPFPGLGPVTAQRIPDDARQVVVVRGGPDARASVALYTWGPVGWTATAVWPARTGKGGWAEPARRTEGNLRSPAGVFTLTDAGGRLAAPAGTMLPYTRSDDFLAAGRGLEGQSLAGVFDYVVAIDFNRVPGRSPLDGERPDDPARGGGIWFHVEHTGPTHGCVALPRPAMLDLLRTLRPAAHPVVVMGPAADLDR